METMQRTLEQITEENGFMQYEISNYARKGLESIHNINYWENGSYIGLGSGAVSCFSGLRVQSEESPERFIEMVDMQRKPFKEAEFLSLDARFRESVIVGLRMTAGVSISRLEKQFGLTPEKHYGETLKSLYAEGFVEEKGSRLRLTRRGLPVANMIMAQLV